MSLNSINNLDSLDNNKRVIWEFTIGIPITYHHSFDNKKKLFEDAVIDITRKLTQITEGLTYQYCYGTYCEGTYEGTKVPSSSLYEGTKVPSSSLLLTKEKIVSQKILLSDLDKKFERNYSVRISIIVLQEIAEEVYNSAQTIISNANIKYGLDIKYIQAMKSYATAHHFCMKEPTFE